MRRLKIGDSVRRNGKNYIVEDYDENNFYLRDENDLVVNVPTKEEFEEEPKTECKGEELILALKIAVINLRTLHRNLKGGNWYRIHEQLGEFYDKLDEFEDGVVENFMAMGMNDISVAEGVNQILPVKPYDEKEAMTIAKQMMDNVKRLSMETRTSCDIPTDVAPMLDELEQYIHIESDYKIANYLNGKE